MEIPEEARLILLTMGGGTWDYSFLKEVENWPDLYLIVSGGNGQFPSRPNLKRLAPDSPIFHPDLVNACNAVIGKVGYSTLTEVYQAGLLMTRGKVLNGVDLISVGRLTHSARAVDISCKINGV